MTLYLARHGQTEWNRDGRMQGRLGGPLTETGRAQAVDLAAAARALGVRRLLTSPLPRAVETARVVAAALGVDPVMRDELVETDFGECSGLTEAQIADRFPGLRAERERDKWSHRWPGGESYADMAERVRPLVEGGELRGADGTMVVAHQSLNRVLARALGPASRADVLAMAQPSTALLRFSAPGEIAHADTTELRWRPGLWR